MRTLFMAGATIGAVAGEAGGRTEVRLQGPRPVFFFAPAWVAQRVKDWGGMGACRSFSLLLLRTRTRSMYPLPHNSLHPR